MGYLVDVDAFEGFRRLENVLENSSYNSQIRQLRILAEAVLTRYDVGNARLSLLSHRKDTVFRVNSYARADWTGLDVAKSQESRFVLHLCDPDGLDQQMLHSELQWLSALRRDTDLLVPEPVLTRDGAAIVSVQVEDVKEERVCVLLRWVPGRSVDSGLSPTLFERVGLFMARLHQHARYFVPPSDFSRPSWHWETVIGDQTILDPDFAATHCDDLITGHEYRLLSEVAARARDELELLPQSADHYGLIHGNFQQANYLFYRGDISAIDFQQCGWNYYLFDIAITFDGIAGRPDEDALRQAFWRGYKRVRALPTRYEELVSIFTALRLIAHLNVLFRSDDRAVRALISKDFPLAFEQLQQRFSTHAR
jgi:Ser/Thr protein kinase RdoA (MazF antagonist)